MDLNKLTRNSIPGILCGIIIMILTLLPGSLFPRVKPTIGLDKLAHIFMYAGFTFSCLWGYRSQFISNGIAYKKRAILHAIIISLAYGGLTELIQEYLVSTRTGDLFDYIADCIGTGLGALLFYVFFRRKK